MLRALAKLFKRRVDGVASRTPVDAPAAGAELDDELAAVEAALQRGALQEALQRVRTILGAHPDAAKAHYVEGRILQRQKQFMDARDSYLLACSFAPEWWVPPYQLGLLEFDCGNFRESVEPLRTAIARGANNAVAHNTLGAAYLRLGNIPAAADEFRKAVALQPDLAHAQSNLGYVLFHHMEEYDEGARHIERALELAPGDAGVLCNWIMVLVQRGLSEEALRITDKLLARDPGVAEARLNRALVLLAKGDFERAWPDYEARKRLPDYRPQGEHPWPEWNGNSLPGRCIFVYAEQGLGDEIMFASCVPDLLRIADVCTIECHPKLEALFRRSFPQAETVVRGTWRTSHALLRRPPDCKVSIASLPSFFRRSCSDFPEHHGYLTADPARVEHWRRQLAKLPGRMKVGISWKGGLATTRRSLRSVPLQEWMPVLTVPGVDFVSVQHAATAQEIAAVSATNVTVQHWPEAIENYDETAALVCALDLIISVQTAVVHLAGALGKSTWALVPAIAEWRYAAHGERSIWYPALDLIRQQQPGDWSAVMHRVRAALSARQAGVRVT